MDCQSLRVLSNVCTVLVEKDQRQLATEHAAEMQKLRDELEQTKIRLTCTCKVLDDIDKEALYWRVKHQELEAIVRRLTFEKRYNFDNNYWGEREDGDFFSQVYAEVQ